MIAALALAVLATIAGYGFVRGPMVDIDRAPSQTARFQIDINAADWPEIALLPDVGETLARRIVQWRSEKGPFADPDELIRVPGIGPRKLARIKPYLLPLPEPEAVAGP